MKFDFKKKAIKLRKEGKVYSEILMEVPVSKSTLSHWLRDIRLNRLQNEILNKKKLIPSKLGALARRKQRIKKTKSIVKKAIQDIDNLNKRDLWYMGIMLYWAEGSKQNENIPSREVIFTNSDPLMIKLYMLWLKDCLEISEHRIAVNVYVNKSIKKSERSLKSYWSNVTSIPLNKFGKTVYVSRKVKRGRKNRRRYWGVLRIKIRKSADLNRKIKGWIEGVCLKYKL